MPASRQPKPPARPGRHRRPSVDAAEAEREGRKAEEYRMVSMATQDNNQEESFAALFEESLKHEDVKEGDIVKGRVIHVGKDHVVVDIGYKSEGTIPLYEFTQADGTV